MRSTGSNLTLGKTPILLQTHVELLAKILI